MQAGVHWCLGDNWALRTSAVMDFKDPKAEPAPAPPPQPAPKPREVFRMTGAYFDFDKRNPDARHGPQDVEKHPKSPENTLPKNRTIHSCRSATLTRRFWVARCHHPPPQELSRVPP